MAKALLALIVFAVMSTSAIAGIDAVGAVAQMWLDPSGNLWFRLANTSADAYCASSWHNNNLYVPAADPNFAYYYGIVLASITKNVSVIAPNISFYNGSTSCDITKTGYGLELE